MRKLNFFCYLFAIRILHVIEGVHGNLQAAHGARWQEGTCIPGFVCCIAEGCIYQLDHRIME